MKYLKTKIAIASALVFLCLFSVSQAAYTNAWMATTTGNPIFVSPNLVNGLQPVPFSTYYIATSTTPSIFPNASTTNLTASNIWSKNGGTLMTGTGDNQQGAFFTPTYTYLQSEGGNTFLLLDSGMQLYATGNINIQSTLGKYNFFNGVSNDGILDFTSIASTNKTFTLPNQSGTICIVGVTCDGSGGGTGNVSTSTNETAGSIAYWTSNSGTPALLGQVATGTISTSGGITTTAGSYVIGSGVTIGCTAASASSAGCLSAANWTTFNNGSNIWMIDSANYLSATTTNSYGVNANASGQTYGYAIGDRLLAYASSTNQSTIFGIGAGGQNATTSSTIAGTTAIGFNSLTKLTSGTGNTSIGVRALNGLTTGSHNTAIGAAALGNVNNSSNIAIGEIAASGYTGNNNIIIGPQFSTNAYSGSGSVLVGSNVLLPSTSVNGQLNISNVLYGTGLYNDAGGTTQTSYPSVDGKIGIGTTTPLAQLTVEAGTSNTSHNLFLISSSTPTATTTVFLVNNIGQTGVGTSTPSATLAVQGTVQSSGDATVANLTATGTVTSLGTASSTFTGGIDAARVCIKNTTTCLSPASAGGVTAVTATWPVLSSGGATPVISWGGLASSSPIAAGAAVLYATGVNTFASAATGTISVSGGITATAAQYIIGSGLTIGCTTATASAAGCISAASFSKHDSATTTFSTGLTYTGATNVTTCDIASASVFGCLTAASFSKFNSATTTFSSPLVYTAGTNAVTCPTCQLNSVYNFPIAGNATSTAVGFLGGLYSTAASTTIAYASTTALTVGGVGGLYIGTLNGPLQSISGAVTATSTLSVFYGGTGANTLTGCLTGNGAAPITGSGTCNTSNASVSSVATNAGLTGGTITTTGTIGLDLTKEVANTLQIWNGTQLAATGTPSLTAGYFIATTTNASQLPYASTTALTVSGAIYIPNAADPSIISNGQLAVNTTAASSSLHYYDGTAERALFPVTERTFVIASSTLLSYKGLGATSTIEWGPALYAQTWMEGTCFASSTGTGGLRFGDDGGNYMEYIPISSTPSVITFATNNAFTRLEKRYLQIRAETTLTVDISCSIGVRRDAD